MIQQLLTIARNTFVESIRQPIYVVLLLLATAMLILNPSLSAYTLDDDNKIMVDMGLSTLFITGLLLSAFMATGVLSAEIESRTVLTVVSKPVSRPLFVLGKYTGVAVALALAFWTLLLIFQLTVRHEVMERASDKFDMPVILFGVLGGFLALFGAALANYFYRWVFTSTFVVALAATLTVAVGLVLVIDKHWQFQSMLTDLDGQFLTAVGLVFEAVLILTAVAIACSTRLGQVMTLVICTLVFLLGLISNYFNERTEAWFADVSGSLSQHVVYGVLKALYLAIPNLQYLWQADALTQNYALTGAHVLLLSGYSLLYIAAVLCVAVALFQTREVG